VCLSRSDGIILGNKSGAYTTLCEVQIYNYLSEYVCAVSYNIST
jgi:hypothetical protein